MKNLCGVGKPYSPKDLVEVDVLEEREADMVNKVIVDNGCNLIEGLHSHIHILQEIHQSCIRDEEVEVEGYIVGIDHYHYRFHCHYHCVASVGIVGPDAEIEIETDYSNPASDQVGGRQIDNN